MFTISPYARISLIIFISVVIGLILFSEGWINTALNQTKNIPILQTIVAGALFVSAFTIGPGGVALAEIAAYKSALFVAFWGALGSSLIDVSLFFLIRKSLTKRDRQKKLTKLWLFRKKSAWFYRITPLLGALIIASPLPDELGLSILGMSRAHVVTVCILIAIFNFAGVLAVAKLAQAL